MKSKTVLEFHKQVKAGHKTPPLKINKTKFRQIISDQSEFLTRHRKVSLFRQSRQKGRKIREASQRSLIKSALQSERAFKNSIKSSLDIALDNKAQLKTAQEQTLANFDDFRIYSNPIFFNKEIRDTLIKMGLSIKELRHYHDILFINNKNAKIFKQAFMNENFETILRRAKGNIDNVPFPESNKILGQMGIVTITGGEDAVAYVVGAVSIAVGVVASVFGQPEIGFLFISAGAKLIAEEGWQDLTGTQDGGWKWGPVEIGGKFPMVNSNAGYSMYETPSNYSGRYYGNRSSSKKEVHNAYCPWLGLITSKHLHLYNSLTDAHSAGLDNCYHCLKGSKR